MSAMRRVYTSTTLYFIGFIKIVTTFSMCTNLAGP